MPDEKHETVIEDDVDQTVRLMVLDGYKTITCRKDAEGGNWTIEARDG